MNSRLVFVSVGSAVLPNNYAVLAVEGLEAVLAAIVCCLMSNLQSCCRNYQETLVPGNSPKQLSVMLSQQVIVF